MNNYKSVKKISFLMPTAKNRFQILNLLPKIHRKKLFLMDIYPNLTYFIQLVGQILPTGCKNGGGGASLT